LAYLTDQLIAFENDQQTKIVKTKGNAVPCSEPSKDITGLSPYTSEESDTNTLLLSHACEDVKEGLTKVMLRTVDTDALVIAISVAEKININKKHFGFLAIHEIESLGPSKSLGFLFFHVLSECDQVLAFANKGKNSTLET
jgi:hypothetical protein